MTNDFNRIAWAYDFLVNITFGSRIWKAQKVHLKNIQKTDSVLIVGGGSGKILDSIDADKVDFLELSAAMIRRAKRRGKGTLIHGDFFESELKRYDWVIFPFFLDCFAENKIMDALNRTKQSLEKEGRVIVTDFEPQNWRHGLLTQLMLAFFRISTSLEATKLSPIRRLIADVGYVTISSEQFSSGFIFSEIYSLPNK